MDKDEKRSEDYIDDFLLAALYFHRKDHQKLPRRSPFKAKHILHCLLCDDKLWSRWEGEMKWCECGKCAIDETSHYYRTVGEKGEFEMIDRVSDNAGKENDQW